MITLFLHFFTISTGYCDKSKTVVCVSACASWDAYRGDVAAAAAAVVPPRQAGGQQLPRPVTLPHPALPAAFGPPRPVRHVDAADEWVARLLQGGGQAVEAGVQALGGRSVARQPVHRHGDKRAPPARHRVRTWHSATVQRRGREDGKKYRNMCGNSQHKHVQLYNKHYCRSF